MDYSSYGRQYGPSYGFRGEPPRDAYPSSTANRPRPSLFYGGSHLSSSNCARDPLRAPPSPDPYAASRAPLRYSNPGFEVSKAFLTSRELRLMGSASKSSENDWLGPPATKTTPRRPLGRMCPTAAQLAIYLSCCSGCAGHDCYCVVCTPTLGFMVRCASLDDIAMPSTPKKASKPSNPMTMSGYSDSDYDYESADLDPMGVPRRPAPEERRKLSKPSGYNDYYYDTYGQPTPSKKESKAITSTGYGYYNDYNSSERAPSTKKAPKATKSTTSGYNDYKSTSGGSGASTASTPYPPLPANSPFGALINASPHLRHITYGTRRASESPYACADSPSGHPIWCLLDTGAASTSISPTLLRRAFPNIHQYRDQHTVFHGIGGGTTKSQARVNLELVWTGLDGRQVITRGEAWVAEEGDMEDLECDVLLGLPFMRDNGINLQWCGSPRKKSRDPYPQFLGDTLVIGDVVVLIGIRR